MGLREKITRTLALIFQIICTSLIIAFVSCEIFRYGQKKGTASGDSRYATLALIGRIQFSIWITLTYFAYCILCFKTETRSFLANSVPSGSVYEYVHELQRSAPHISLNVSCYHHVTTTRTTTDANGKSSTSTETRRVVTHQESRPFRYVSWEDVSQVFLLSIDEQQAKKSKPCLKLYLKKNWIFTDEQTLNAYRDAQAQIVVDNRWRDTHMDYYERMDLANFESYVLTFVGNRRPPWFGSGFFYLSVFLMLGVAYCFYVDYLCYTQEFSIEKRVSVLPQVQVQPNFSPVSVSEAAPTVYNQQQGTPQLGVPTAQLIPSYQQQQQYYNSQVPPPMQYQQPYYQSQPPTYQNYVPPQQTNDNGYSKL